LDASSSKSESKFRGGLPPGAAYSLWQLIAYALKLGTLGFGGPAALVGCMHRDLVEDRQWISEAYGKRPAIVAFVEGVTAAAIGTIAGAVLVLGQRSITDLPTLVLALATAALLAKTKRVPEPVIVLAAAIVGLIVLPPMKG